MIRAQRPLVVAPIVTTLVIVAACSTGSTRIDSSDASPAQDSGSDVDARVVLPPCTTAPWPTPFGYPPSYLLDGGCSDEGARCEITINPCCRPSSNNLIDGYACACNAGQWQCAINSPGGGYCPFGALPNCTDGG